MFECKVHGRIRGRKDVQYCPICGKEVVRISLFPLLNLYVWKGDLAWAAAVLGGAAVAIVALVLSLSPKSSHGPARGAGNDARVVARMAPGWQFVYRGAERMPMFERQAFVTRYLRENGSVLESSRLSPEEVQVFLTLFPQYEIDEVLLLLGRYVDLSATAPGVGPVEGVLPEPAARPPG